MRRFKEVKELRFYENLRERKELTPEELRAQEAKRMQMENDLEIAGAEFFASLRGNENVRETKEMDNEGTEIDMSVLYTHFPKPTKEDAEMEKIMEQLRVLPKKGDKDVPPWKPSNVGLEPTAVNKPKKDFGISR